MRKIERLDAWCRGYRRCFLQWIDQAKATPMVGSPIGNVARKVGWKSSPKNFPIGDLVAKGSEASCNEGGMVRVRHGH